MKKITTYLLLLIVPFILSGCYEIKYNSLDEYKEYITNSKIGHSDFELDHPKYFLPTYTYLNDYTYLEGSYHFYSNSPFCDLDDKKQIPDRTLIVLKYDKDVYYEAKKCALDNIPIYEDKYYFYNNYQFYVNQNFMDSFDDKHRPEVPEWFTMVCYNDENNMICFLGFNNSYPKLDEKYLNDLDNNWISFIDTYYGEYYDFSK